MKPPGRTTLARMQRTAALEAERIEISQDARVHGGLIKQPMPEQVEKRDDFAGMVNLIDAIQSDQLIMDRLKERIKAQAALRAPPAADAEDVEIEGEDR